MAEFGVGFKLTADASQFQRELRESIETTKGVQRGLKDIGVNIGGLIGISAVINAFKATINAAQELRDKARESFQAIDAGVESVAKFGDGIDAIKTSIRDFSISALSVFTKVGEELGRGLLTWTEGATAKSAEAAGKITEEAEKNIARIAKARTEFLAKQEKETIEAERKIAEIRESRLMKEASDAEKLGLILAKQLEIETQLAQTNADSLKYKQLQIELEKTITAEGEVRASLAKAEVETQERINKQEEALRKDREQAYQKTRLNKEEELELTKLQLKGAANLTDAERARYDVLMLQTEQKRVQAQIETALERPASERSAAEQKNLAALFKQNDSLTLQIEQKSALISQTQAQVVEEQKVTAERERQSQIGFRVQTSKNFEQASDESLRALIQRNRQEAIDITNPALGGSGYNNFSASILRFNADAAERELKFRESLRRDFALGGEDLARRNFKGDPLAFDAVFQRFVEDTRDAKQVAKEQTDQLKDLNTRLARVGFTK